MQESQLPTPQLRQTIVRAQKNQIIVNQASNRI